MQRSYIPLNKIEISKDALIYNNNLLQKMHPNSGICPVLKSNAYGHGLKQVAQIFDELNCPFLIVDSLYEAYELHKLHIKTPILILGYTDPRNFSVKPLPFHVAVFDIATARMLNACQKGCNVHLFVDTGMSREGISMNDLPLFLKELSSLKNLNVVGLCSHFADTDNMQSQKFTQQQIKQFKNALSLLQKYGYSPQWRHISASAGAYTINDPTFNMIRAGLAWYGIGHISLKPVLQFTSTLAQIKRIKKGEKIGYNCTYTAKKDMIIGLLPAGYYEGVDRRLSNKGSVKMRNVACPIIGRVSMNMTTIDITDLPHPQIGETVVIYSSNPQDLNSIAQASQTAETIPYDLLVHLAHTVKREVVS